MNAIQKRAMKQAIAVFVITMVMGRIAAPLVFMYFLGPVIDWSETRGLIWICLLAGTAICGLLSWLQYYLAIRANESQKAAQG